jgi:CD63 antigen
MKWLNILFTMIFLLAGAILIGASAYVFATNGGVLANELSNLGPIAILVMVLGSIIFVVSFLGCCGSCQESRCLLNMYAIILFILIICEVSMGIYAFVHRGTVVDRLTQNSWDKMPVASRNEIENDFKCCGWSRYDQDGMCDSANHKYDPFCETLVINWFHKSFFILAMTALGVGIVQIFGLISSCCLSSSIKAAKNREHDREKLLRDAREANRYPHSHQPQAAPQGQVQYSGYGYQQGKTY